MIIMPGNTSLTRADIIRQFLPTSPFVGHLGIQLTDMQSDLATLTLPFANSLITIGTTIHGGAIASLIDTTAMVAAWSDDTVPENLRGTTVSLTVTYLAPAEHEDIQATARVLRRGRNLVYLDVDVQSVSGKSIAKALVTKALGSAKAIALEILTGIRERGNGFCRETRWLLGNFAFDRETFRQPPNRRMKKEQSLDYLLHQVCPIIRAVRPHLVVCAETSLISCHRSFRARGLPSGNGPCRNCLRDTRTRTSARRDQFCSRERLRSTVWSMFPDPRP